ncbi:MAG: hypothetical protein OXG60_20375 [Chloroflexi bacterium]|nr:hypothetical protein [Chloroflexota bacterium]
MKIQQLDLTVGDLVAGCHDDGGNRASKRVACVCQELGVHFQ